MGEGESHCGVEVRVVSGEVSGGGVAGVSKFCWYVVTGNIFFHVFIWPSSPLVAPLGPH